MPASTFDVVVAGAGPAGLAAASAAAQGGARVAVVDSAGRPGGQFWRHPEHGSREVADLQHDTRTFAGLVSALRSTTYLPGHEIWSVTREDDGFRVHALYGDTDVAIRAHTLVLATGAYDRQLRFPGFRIRSGPLLWYRCLRHKLRRKEAVKIPVKYHRQLMLIF
jgi:D-hydroxyproline dehydrogenase subunit alpha